MPKDKPKRAPRQMSDRREQELLQAAREIFFSHGVNAATMDDIARRASSSKATLYRRYKTKEELFEAIILESANGLAEELEQFELNIDKPLESLRNAAHHVRKALTTPDHINVYRQIIAEMARQPDLCIHARGLITEALTRRLTAFFEQLIARGLMHHDYPHQAATTFVLISAGGIRPLVNAMESRQEEDLRLKADLKMFFAGCGIRDKASS